MKLPVAAGALMVVLPLAGCGGSETPPVSPTVPAETPAEAGEAEGGQVVVDIVELQFVPEDVNVPAGATIVFTNSDDVSHTVTKRSGPGPDFDSGPIEPGGTFQQVFPKEGVVEVFDTSRPRTELTITVEESGATEEEEAEEADRRGGGGDRSGGGSGGGGN
jgi:plastocyanin